MADKLICPLPARMTGRAAADGGDNMACIRQDGVCVRELTDEEIEFDTFACDGCEFTDVPPSPCSSCSLGRFHDCSCVEFEEWYRLCWS